MTPLATLERGLEELERRFEAALDAALPNPVAMIFSDLPLAYQGKRDLVFALDLLNEGENECALIAGFVGDRLRAASGADVAHLTREAWYYLRTSIDATWQFDDGEPSLPAALAYLAQVLRERTDAVRAAPRPANFDAARGAERAALLRRLRAEAGTLTAPL
ncbi:MAG TPA: hypothetical protein VIJ64_09935 [Candidatus Lustribacter sp.]